MKQILCALILGLATLIAASANDNTKMEEAGMVDVSTALPEVVVNLMYARPDNFTGVTLYTTLSKAYLHPIAMRSLVAAQTELTRLHPGYRLKIYDAARPMSAQKRMYDVVKGTSKARYVSNPRNGGGLHNYGMAVDITIVDDNGIELDMGTKVDHLGPEAHITNEQRLSKQQQANRRLLRQVMTHGGFTPLKSEWWHFNRCTRPYARAHYPLLNF